MYRQSEKYFLNSNISSRCPHNMVNIGPLTAEIGWGSLGHHSKFQRVLRLRFVTAPTSHNGGQQNFARYLAVAWAATIYNYYTLLGLLPLTEFCQVQNSVCIQVLHYPILAALLHGTRAVGISQFMAWYKEWNYGTFAPRHFQQRAPPIFPRRPPRWAHAHILVLSIALLSYHQNRFMTIIQVSLF